MQLVWIGESILSSLSTSSGAVFSASFRLVGEVVASEIRCSTLHPTSCLLHILLDHLNSRATKKLYTPTTRWNLRRACEDPSRNHRTSTPHRSETNGVAERAVRRVKEGTLAVLLQSGLDERWWSDTVECCCYLRSAQDRKKDDVKNHSKGQQFFLEQRLNIIRFHRAITQEFINSARKFYQESYLAMS